MKHAVMSVWAIGSIGLAALACSESPASDEEVLGSATQALTSQSSSAHAVWGRIKSCYPSTNCTYIDYKPSNDIDAIADQWGFPTWITESIALGATSGNVEVWYYDRSYVQLTNIPTSGYPLPTHKQGALSVSISRDPTTHQWRATAGTGSPQGYTELQMYYQNAADSCGGWQGINRSTSSYWTGGNVSACLQGSNTYDRAQTLAMLNLIRGIVGQSSNITYVKGTFEDAQAWALMEMANGQISHDPPASWKCFSQAGYNAASGWSVSSETTGVLAIGRYLSEVNSDTTNLGHRQIILSQALSSVDIGSTSTYSGMACNMDAPYQWGYVAWPSGNLPLAALDRINANVSGWSIQSNDATYADLCTSPNLQITVNRYDYGIYETPHPNQTYTYSRANVQVLGGGFSSCAIKFVPQWFTSGNPQWYHIKVTGIAVPIEYDVNLLDCGYYGR
jgi:hypothetical protein